MIHPEERELELLRAVLPTIVNGFARLNKLGAAKLAPVTDVHIYDHMSGHLRLQS